ncbi:hypothetical protein [Nostoc sp. TCL240-02]|nr:hypothetical protein [Nostoc sp. TCL240-02]
MQIKYWFVAREGITPTAQQLIHSVIIYWIPNLLHLCLEVTVGI